MNTAVKEIVEIIREVGEVKPAGSDRKIVFVDLGADFDYSLEAYRKAIAAKNLAFGERLKIRFPFRVDVALYSEIVHLTVGWCLGGFKNQSTAEAIESYLRQLEIADWAASE